jgi:hypothetical protein
LDFAAFRGAWAMIWLARALRFLWDLPMAQTNLGFINQDVGTQLERSREIIEAAAIPTIDRERLSGRGVRNRALIVCSRNMSPSSPCP